MKEITVRGSFVGSRNDLEAAYQTAVRAGIHLDSEEAPLDEVNEVFRRIREGKTSSRILLRPVS
jgi:propanol-preferring alcohol dehydrogenase